MRPQRTGLHMVRRSSRTCDRWYRRRDGAGMALLQALAGTMSAVMRLALAARDLVLRSSSGRAVRGAVSRRGPCFGRQSILLHTSPSTPSAWYDVLTAASTP